MKKVLVALAAASWLAACGSNNNTTTPTPTGPQQYDQTQKPVSPKGSIYGRVIDQGTLNPLEGVSVKVLGSDQTLTTSAEGTFKLENAAVNSTYTFIFEKTGYVRGRTTASIQGSAGNSPLEGSITSFTMNMYPTTGSISGVVFLPGGKPAPNATVFVNQSFSLNSNYESIVTAQTGMDGTFSLAGLATAPGGVSHTVYAQWYDENGDMQADYSTTSLNVTLQPTQAARIFITYGAIAQRIVASNIIDGEVAAGEELSFTFSLPLFTGTLQGSSARPVTLTDDTVNGIDIPVDVTFMSPTVVKVKPSVNSLTEGHLYTINFALRNASTSSNTNNSFTNSFSFQVRAATVAPYTTQVGGLTLLNGNPVGAPFPDTAFDYNSNNFTISWTPAAGATRYEIYARDTLTTPNFTRVASGILANGAPRYTQTINLPSSFTQNFASGPLANNNQVFFAVVGIDAYGSRAPLSGAMTVSAKDTVPPRVTSGPTVLGTNRDGINDGSAPAEIRLRINYSEPMDPTSMVTWTTNAASAPMAAWRWDSTTAGVLTLTIGAGNDATGTYVIRGGKDSAGNDVQQASDLLGSLGGRREILSAGSGDFINLSNNMCSLASWTTGGTGPTPVALANNGSLTGSLSACAAVLGSVPGGMPGTGRSRITQSLNLPQLMNTGFSIEATGRYRTAVVVNQANPGATYTMRCFIADTNDTQLVAWFSAAGTAAYQTAPALNLNAQANTTVRLICETENTNMMAPGFGAMYLDELSVSLVKPGTL